MIDNCWALTLRRLGLLAALVVVASDSAPARSASAAEIAQLDKDGRAVLGEMDKLLKEDVENTRKTCASGQAPAWVTAKRARYGATQRFADASDMCVASLGALAGDKRLLVYYQELLAAIGGNPGLYAELPRSIGAAALNGAAKVAIGNSKAAVMTPALAFDAGFTIGYQDGASAKPGATDQRQLKAVAEACLGQQNNAGTCFSIGFAYGAQAAR